MLSIGCTLEIGIHYLRNPTTDIFTGRYHSMPLYIAFPALKSCQQKNNIYICVHATSHITEYYSSFISPKVLLVLSYF